MTALDGFYFGTNEAIAFDSTGQFLQSLKVTPITKEFYDQLKKQLKYEQDNENAE